MAVAVPTPPGALLLSALFLSAAFAGCFDHGADDAEDAAGALFQRERRTPVTIDEVEDYYRIRPPAECQGCIPLDEPATTVEVERHVHHRPQVTVPYPRMGDVVAVSGDLDHDARQEDPAVPLRDGDEYAFFLRATNVSEQTAVFRLIPYNRDAIGLPVDLGVTGVTWNVSLDSRAIIDLVARGLVVTHHPGHTAQNTATAEVRPPLETLFWLGAHVWGRSLSTGDAFSTLWPIPGPYGESLRFDYRVLRAERDSVPTQGTERARHEWTGDLRLRVTAEDAAGNSMEWEMVFDDASPYPIEMERRAHYDSDLVHDTLPLAVLRQRAELLDRGTGDIPWKDAILRAVEAPARPDGYLLGERVAPEALDALPRYPLKTALADLMTVSDYADFQTSTEERVLVEARYETRYDLGDTHQRHTWTLHFTSRHNDFAGWSISRSSNAAGLLPVATESAPEHPPSPLVLRFLADHMPSTPLSNGEGLRDALADLGIDVVDHLHYRLVPRGEHDIGGRLSAARIVAGPLGGDPVTTFGFGEEDLGQGRLLSLGVVRTY